MSAPTERQRAVAADIAAQLERNRRERAQRRAQLPLVAAQPARVAVKALLDLAALAPLAVMRAASDGRTTWEEAAREMERRARAETPRRPLDVAQRRSDERDDSE